MTDNPTTITFKGVSFTEADLRHAMDLLEDAEREAEEMRLKAEQEHVRLRINPTCGYDFAYLLLSPALVAKIVATSQGRTDATDYITLDLDGGVHWDSEETALRMPFATTIR